jgi:LysR family transcriptional regulator, transcription activator of glutamate synthase operon
MLPVCVFITYASNDDMTTNPCFIVMKMDTDALRWFQQVADGATVTEVSDLEPVTQSGVSRALARLEAEVGTPLLRKSGRTLRMTHAGAVFKRHVDALVHNLDDGLAAVNELLDPDTGTVVLAFQHSLGTWLVPDLLLSFRAAHPSVRFELHQMRDELHASILYGGRADLEIAARRPAEPAVHSRPIALEPLRLVTARDHRLCGAATVRLTWSAQRRLLPAAEMFRQHVIGRSAAGRIPAVSPA